MTAIALAWAPAASATIVRAFSLPGLTTAAHSVIRGHVIDREVVYDAQRQGVYTHTFVAVDEVLTGTSRVGDVVAVRQIGGVLDGLETRVVGTADLELGDEVVLFARTDGAFHYLVGMAQGKYEVLRGPGAPTLVRDLSGVVRALVPGPTHASAPDRLTLDGLRTLVADTLAGRGR